MNSKVVVGLIVVILGVVIAFGPQILFPVCEASKVIKVSSDDTENMKMTGMDNAGAMKMDGTKKMRCYQTGIASLLTGIGIAVVGIFSIVTKKKQIRLVLHAGLMPLGILVALYPTVLTGVCKSVHASCHLLTKPSMVILGVIVSVIAVSKFYLELKHEG